MTNQKRIVTIRTAIDLLQQKLKHKQLMLGNVLMGKFGQSIAQRAEFEVNGFTTGQEETIFGLIVGLAIYLTMDGADKKTMRVFFDLGEIEESAILSYPDYQNQAHLLYTKLTHAASGIAKDLYQVN